MREVDRLMIEAYGILLIQMMKNAGRSLATLASTIAQEVPGKSVLVLAGARNNGGGGLVAARHLSNMGAQAGVIFSAGAHELPDMPALQTSILTKVGGHPLFVVLSREQAKLSYRWSPAVVERLAVVNGQLLRGEEGEPVRRLCCPACFAPALDNEGLPLEREQLERKKKTCRECSGPLWQADRSGPRRFPLADYIARRMPAQTCPPTGIASTLAMAGPILGLADGALPLSIETAWIRPPRP